MALGGGNRAEADRSTVRNRVPLQKYHDIPNVPFTAGRRRMLPHLPLKLDPSGDGWPNITHSWWASVREMPQCVLWTDTDWEYAACTAFIHREVWRGDFRLAGELRQRERAMGCTDEGRRALRIRYIDPEPEQAAPVTALHAVDQPPKPAQRRVPAFDPSAVGGK